MSDAGNAAVQHDEIVAFADYLAAQREPLIERWRQSVLADQELADARQLSYDDFVDHIPVILDRLDQVLRFGGGGTLQVIQGSREHGAQRFSLGYDFDELIRELGLLNVELVRSIAAYRALGHALGAEATDHIALGITLVLNVTTAESASEYSHARRGVEQKLVRANALLEEQNVVKSRFVSTVAHELRAPLNVIAGVSQILARSRETLGANARLSDMLARNVENLIRLLNDLLDYSRLVSGRDSIHLERFDLSHVVESFVDAYRPEAAEKLLELRVDAQQPLPTVHSDRTKVGQIIANLVSNAIKFSEKGSITVSVTALDADYWQLAVADTGTGIGAAELPTIFEEFVRLASHRSIEGTGLGLPIVKRTVEMLGGTIRAESTLGVGSTFTVALPVRSPVTDSTGET